MSKLRPDDFRDKNWPKGLYRRSGAYRFRRLHKGKQINKTLGDISERQAVERTEQLNLQLDAGIDVAKNLRHASLTCREFIEEYLKQKASGWAPKSLARYRAAYDNFLNFLGDPRRILPLAAIDYATASSYLTARASQPIMPNGSRKFTRAQRGGAKPKTLLFELEALRSLFREARKRDLVDANPFEQIKIKKPTREQVAAGHRILNEKEIEALLKTATQVDEGTKDGNARLTDLLLFMLRTGMREGEVRVLEWSDVDFSEGLIHVKPKRIIETRQTPIPLRALPKLRKILKEKALDAPAFTPEEARTVKAGLFVRRSEDLLGLKAGDIDLEKRTLTLTREWAWKPKASSGSVPMAPSVRALLERLQKEQSGRSPFVFDHRDGGPCRIDILEKLKLIQAKAGIRGHLRVHDLRHTCGATLRKKGVPLETIMGILRHADIRETLCYAPYHIEEGKKAIALLDG
jgi:integrase